MMDNLFPVQNDAEAVCIEILNNSTEVAAFSPTISSDLVGYAEGMTFVSVTRQGGNVSRYKIDRPRIDFSVTAPSRSTAHDLAQAVQAAVMNARGTVHYQSTINDVRVETGLFRTYDKLNSAVRYVFALRLTLTPNS